MDESLPRKRGASVGLSPCAGLRRRSKAHRRKLKVIPPEADVGQEVIIQLQELPRRSLSFSRRQNGLHDVSHKRKHKSFPNFDISNIIEMTDRGQGGVMLEKFDGRPRTGSCLCGGIRFRIEQGSNDVVMCHCVFCRRSITSVGAYIRCDPADLVLLSGRPKGYRSSPTARRGFCSKCGSQLFWEPTRDAHVAVSAGSLDQSDGLRVTEHIYADQRPASERLDKAEPALMRDDD